MEKTKTSKKKVIGIAAIAIAAALLVGYFTTVYAAKPEEEETLMREYPVSRGDITAGTDGAGKLMVDDVAHNFKSPVTVGELYVKAGDTVKKGDKLAKLSKESLGKKLEELELSLKKAKISLADAQNNKKTGMLGLNGAQEPGAEGSAEYQAQRVEAQSKADAQTQVINDINSKIAAIDAQLAQLAEGDGQAASLQAQRSEQEALLNEAKNTLDGLNATVASIDSAREQQVNGNINKSAEAKKKGELEINGYDNAVDLAVIGVEEIEMQIKEVQEALAQDEYIYAKTDGLVSEVNYPEGAETTLEKAVVAVSPVSEIYAVAQVSQSDIGGIEEGQQVELSLDAYPGKIFDGTVKKKMPTPVKDSNPTAYNVLVSIDAGGEDLLPGMTLSAQFIVKQVKDVLMLSNKAIKMADGKQIVILKDEDGNTYEQEIKTGFSDGKFTEVLSGLADGDIAYVEG